MDNGIAVQLFLGAMYGGLVAVPLNVNAGATQLSYMLDHSDAKIVFVGEAYRDMIQEVTAAESVKVIPSDGAATPDTMKTNRGQRRCQPPSPRTTHC